MSRLWDLYLATVDLASLTPRVLQFIWKKASFVEKMGQVMDCFVCLAIAHRVAAA
jgi:hypothetical protein